MRTLSESIIGRKGIQPSTNIISDCRDMISRIEHSPWKEAMEMATDYYDVLIQNRHQYPREVQQILDDSIKEWSGKALSKIARTDIMIQAIRSISNLAKKTKIMNSIKESIIGRRGVPRELHEFNDLKYGDFVTIEVPEAGINNVYLYVPNNILKIPEVKSDKNGIFMCPMYSGSGQSDIVIDGMGASKFVKNFPICPESAKYYYSEITKYNGHTEEYKYIKDENDVVELFRKYRFL